VWELRLRDARGPALLRGLRRRVGEDMQGLWRQGRCRGTLLRQLRRDVSGRSGRRSPAGARRDARGGAGSEGGPEARELLAEGKAHAEKSHAKVLLPEIECLHAQALMLTGQIDAPQAIVRIEAAAARARQQGAVMLEWRAAMALAPLYSGAGRDAEARELLRTHYAAFTQGFATPDLLEGKKLLDGLS
jgi:hypothetical protein